MQKCNKQQSASLILSSLVLHVFVILVIFYYIFPTENRHLDISVNDDEVIATINNTTNTLGEGYFSTWIVVDKDKFYYKDVVGCNKIIGRKGFCYFSVKKLGLNPEYLKIHDIDPQTYSFLDEMPSGEPAFYDNMDDLENFSTIKDILDNSNITIIRAGFIVVKNHKTDIVYVFIISDTNIKSSHDKKELNKYLRELSRISRRVI